MTGGTGLVGPRLLGRLSAAGVECRALVRPGKEVPEGVQRAEGDILSPDSLPAAVKGVTAVIHLAAVFRTRDDDQIWTVNRDGTRNLIAAVEQHAPEARFLLASTSNIYDADSTHPGREDDPVAPALAYPASKIEAEQLLRASGLTWGILRLPFIYGDQDGHLESLPELAAGMGWHPAQRLSVVHHADIATAFALALTGAFDNRTVNIADESPSSIYEISQIVGYSYSSSAEPLSQPWKGQMDVSLARSLGFTPTISTIHEAVRNGAL
ncbi:NAD(P)-dependent oxidoreductase [Micromonospora lupini]|uniref:NAD-dependent epimerase/dehydratase family protein n=1 Tax=Micromonospora lupini TaxID=285679 RepID=UPI002253B96F|nr:NAD(P)-dependent oxidoreductase [Micromonospora lupini]MCX5066003.1 NAD(P)-dependent oxidoreductase [Micromonospora lupini]